MGAALQPAPSPAESSEQSGAGGREFIFTDADFRAFVELAHETAGIALAESKRNLVYSRLARRLRALRLASFKSYRNYLASEEGAAELVNFINAISTNLTKFFREAHHFDHFKTHVAQPAAKGRLLGDNRLRIWSAGCSTGEEPYTIAAVLRREIGDSYRHDARILATDIDTEVLSRAARGRYTAKAVEDVPAAYRTYFEIGDSEDDSGEQIDVAESLRSLISFRQLNLMEQWPFQGRFDAIFCRNVMIYFDAPTKSALVERFASQLKPGGILYIGHSESLLGGHQHLQLVGRTTYRSTK
jgi:chemotaxis protein methyltransferase CheR